MSSGLSIAWSFGRAAIFRPPCVMGLSPARIVEQVSRGPEFRKDAGPLYFLKANDKQKQSRIWYVMRYGERDYPGKPEYRSQDAVSVVDNTPPSTGECDADRERWTERDVSERGRDKADMRVWCWSGK